MFALASLSKSTEVPGTLFSARCGKATRAFIFSIILVSGVAWPDGDAGHAASIRALVQSDIDSAAVAPLANVNLETVSPAETAVVNEVDTNLDKSKATPVTNGAPDVPPVSAAGPDKPAAPVPAALHAGADLLRAIRSELADARRHAAHAVARGRRQTLPKFFARYRSVLKQVAVMGLHRIEEYAALTHATIVGTASTYNPYRDGSDADDLQTSSGETYDPGAWTAAIQIGLRDQFGGVRYGRNYLPAYALVESGDKRVIVRINDVGPLKPGRVIDLNERSMRYFDPAFERGLLSDTRITLLPGEDWTPGPVGGVQLASFTAAQ